MFSNSIPACFEHDLANSIPSYLERDEQSQNKQSQGIKLKMEFNFIIHHFTPGGINAIAGTESLGQVMDGHYRLDRPTIIVPISEADYSLRLESQKDAPDLFTRITDLMQVPLFAFVDTTKPIGVSEYALLTGDGNRGDLRYRILASELRESKESRKMVRHDLLYTKIEPRTYPNALLRDHQPDIIYALQDYVDVRILDNTWEKVHARDRYLRDV